MTGEAPFHAGIAEAPEGVRARWLRTSDGKRIRAVFWPGAGRGMVLVLPGRCEYVEKYGRVVGHLRALGFAAAVIDWRGQGLSDRAPPYPELGHIEDFGAYQLDLAALLAAPEVTEAPGRRILLCHSMGGAIGLRAMIEGAEVEAGIFSAPMWQIRLGRAARIVARPLAGAAVFIGRGNRSMPFTGRRAATANEANPLSSDPEAALRLARQLGAHPELGLGPPSAHWISAALRETARLARLPSPARPMLGFLGDEETVVSPEAIRARFAATPGATLVDCPGARHEILMERPEIEALVWSRIGAFLDRP